MRSKKNVSVHKEIAVYPCTYDTDIFYSDAKLRSVYRKKYGIGKNHIVLLYSGSMQKWQMPDLIFRFFKNIEMQDKENKFKFFCLTFDRIIAEKFIEKYSLKNIILGSSTGKDLVGVYNASDIGVICRKNDLVNRVSSPTKMAEYLATGNSVILTRGIGDYSEELDGKKSVLIKNDLKEFFNTSYEELIKLNSDNSIDRAWIKSRYGNKNNISSFKSVFNDFKCRQMSN